ncbi:unnamed protein product [Schistosoma guineensis]|nr:unnamed protein product [Schistosoma guineensis]
MLSLTLNKLLFKIEPQSFYSLFNGKIKLSLKRKFILRMNIDPVSVPNIQIYFKVVCMQFDWILLDQLRDAALHSLERITHNKDGWRILVGGPYSSTRDNRRIAKSISINLMMMIIKRNINMGYKETISVDKD